MLFVQGTNRRATITSLHNIDQCDKICVEHHSHGRFKIKFYYKTGQGTFEIIYQDKDSAMKDFNDLMKSLEDHRFLWKCSEEGQI